MLMAKMHSDEVDIDAGLVHRLLRLDLGGVDR
jgi:hypothetical protein